MKKLLPLLLSIFLTLTIDAQPRQTSPGSVASHNANGWNLPSQRNKPYVILVAIDGCRADYLDLLETPNIMSIVQNGVRAKGMISVFPSKTLPNLYTIVTGMYAERHGMISNSFYDSKRGQTYSMFGDVGLRDGSVFGGEPIWVTAERQGMVTAPFFWIGAEAAIKGVRPSYWRPYVQETPLESRVETVLGWLRFPPERRPHFISLYFSDVDSAGHDSGPATPAVRTALEAVDKSLGTLLDGIALLEIREQVTIILVSDHGMSETDPGRFIALESLIDVNRVRLGDTGPNAHLYVARLEEARSIRDEINSKLEHGQAYLRAELPTRFHYRRNHRIGDVVIVMDEHYQTGLEARRARATGGAHGWDPELPSMNGIFAAMGPNIKKGATIPTVRNIDIYPFITEILKLRPARGIDGRPGLLRKLVRTTSPAISRRRSVASQEKDGQR
ncbi:MAG: ectonucleotide pyrophosphatase/phosphodiesterase [Acidobacteriota bacterium]